jgi:hypothetical protein
MYEELLSLSKNKGITIENMCLISIIEGIMINKKTLQDKENMLICDIFDMSYVEDIIKYITEKDIDALLVNFNDPDSVIMPIHRYESITGI